MTTASLTRTSCTSPMTGHALATAIRASLHGDLVTPDDASYPAALFGIDPTGGQPEMVVIAADAEDVAVTTRLAIRAGRRVVMQAGGRLSGPVDPSPSPTILIVTRLLARVRIDPSARTATVGIGATWRQVQEAAAPDGLAAVRGQANGVEPQRSGSRQWWAGQAFSAEHITGLDVVTPQGQRVRIDRVKDPAGFESALRRSSQFGLITALRIALLPSDQVYVGNLWFDANDEAAVLRTWHQLVAALPSASSTSVSRHALPESGDLPVPLRLRTVVQVRLTHVGDRSTAAHLLEHLRTAATPLLQVQSGSY